MVALELVFACEFHTRTRGIDRVFGVHLCCVRVANGALVFAASDGGTSSAKKRQIQKHPFWFDRPRQRLHEPAEDTKLSKVPKSKGESEPGPSTALRTLILLRSCWMRDVAAESAACKKATGLNSSPDAEVPCSLVCRRFICHDVSDRPVAFVALSRLSAPKAVRVA